MMRRRFAGFTLIELMIVVAILSILAVIALPAFRKYMFQARAAEAPPNLRKIMDGATVYFYAEHVDSTGVTVLAQFPRSSAGDVSSWYPQEMPRGQKIIAKATDPAPADREMWNQLRFTIVDPVWFHYQWEVSGVGLNSSATVRSEAYLTGDGNACLFERSAATKNLSSLELELSDLKVIAPPY